MKDTISEMALGLAIAGMPYALWLFIAHQNDPASESHPYVYGAIFGLLVVIHLIFRDPEKNKIEMARKIHPLLSGAFGLGFFISLLTGSYTTMFICMAFFLLEYFGYLMLQGYTEKELLRDNDILE